MTQKNLIDLTCRWLDFNQCKYLTETFNNETIIAGCCQTDLRHFLNWAIEKHSNDEYVFYQDLEKEYNLEVKK